MLYDFKSLIPMAHLVCTIMPKVKWLKAERKIKEDEKFPSLLPRKR
jgi:hypothetical protein